MPDADTGYRTKLSRVVFIDESVPVRGMQIAGIMLGSRRNTHRSSFHDDRQEGRLDDRHLGLYPCAGFKAMCCLRERMRFLSASVPRLCVSSQFLLRK